MDTVPKSRSQGKYINRVAQCSWFKTSAYYRYPEICRWLLCLFSLWECLVLKFSLLSWLIFIEEDIGCFIMWLWLALPWHHSFIVRHWLVFLWLQFVLFVILVRYPAAPFVFPVTRVEIPVIFQVMTDVVGNPEEERRADFFHLPWSQEAVCRYFYGKVMITQKLLICSGQMIISSALWKLFS